MSRPGAPGSPAEMSGYSAGAVGVRLRGSGEGTCNRGHSGIVMGSGV